MSPSRLRLVALLALVLLAAGVLLAWSQEWFRVAIDGDEFGVRGDVAAGALAPLALTGLALVAALALAGPVLRVLLGILGALLGVSVIAVTMLSISDPPQSVATAVGEHTGIAGLDSIRAIIDRVDQSVWPWVAVAAGILLILTGALIAVTGPRWPGSGRRYSRTRLTPVEGNPVDDWDALSAGEDPTGGQSAASDTDAAER